MQNWRTRVFRTVGIAMAIGLFWAAWKPEAGEVFGGHDWLHYFAHFSVFAAFASVWTLGLPRIPTFAIAIGVVAFGFLHETFEITGHVHAFESTDALVDALGATVGVLVTRRFMASIIDPA